jgi:hypothetical protein
VKLLRFRSKSFIIVCFGKFNFNVSTNVCFINFFRMTSITKPGDGSHLMTVDQLLLANNSLTSLSTGNNGQIQFVNIVFPDSRVAFIQHSQLSSVFSVGQSCQPINAPSSQIQVPAITPQLVPDAKMSNTSGKHRKTKKRRRLNKVL